MASGEAQAVDGAPDRPTHHGTAIALGHRAVLIVGPSGGGKSDLALRCLTLAPSALIPQAAQLVADDRVILTAAGGRLYVEAPASIAGLIEVRGLGILQVPHVPRAGVALVAELAPPEEIERLPDPPLTRAIDGVELPLVRIAAFEPSAAAKLLLALMRASG